jgi:ABC-2 type transport system ATP-binding protein
LAAEGMTVLVSTHYMDEAERCHRLAYISYGRLLAAGTAAEVVERAGLRTWQVQGGDQQALLALINTAREWMAVPFGSAVHVSSAGSNDFTQWLDAQAPGHAWEVARVPTGLEDVFIALTQDARDNFN